MFWKESKCLGHKGTPRSWTNHKDNANTGRKYKHDRPPLRLTWGNPRKLPVTSKVHLIKIQKTQCMCLFLRLAKQKQWIATLMFVKAGFWKEDCCIGTAARCCSNLLLFYSGSKVTWKGSNIAGCLSAPVTWRKLKDPCTVHLKLKYGDSCTVVGEIGIFAHSPWCLPVFSACFHGCSHAQSRSWSKKKLKNFKTQMHRCLVHPKMWLHLNWIAYLTTNERTATSNIPWDVIWEGSIFSSLCWNNRDWVSDSRSWRHFSNHSKHICMSNNWFLRDISRFYIGKQLASSTWLQ